MTKSRPEFDKITSFDEFNKYYWYREELSQICKSLGLEYKGTKQELNHIIEQYFKHYLNAGFPLIRTLENISLP